MALTLAGCGGGGSSSGGDTTPPATYSLSASISGLAGGTLVLQVNGGPDIGIVSNGDRTLATGLPSGTAYTISVRTQPDNPPQACTLTNATGTIGSANVSNVAVSCTTLPPLALSSSTPVDEAVGVDPEDELTLQFSAPLASTPVPLAQLTLTADGSTTPWALVGSSSAATLVATPGQPLDFLRRHTLTVGADLRGAQGERMSAPVTLDFTTRDGRWVAAKPLHPFDNDLVSAVDMAFDASGSGFALWQTVVGADLRWWLARYTRTGGWATPVPAPGLSARTQEADLDVAPSGDAVLVWVDVATSNGLDVFASHYTQTSGWTPAQSIEKRAGDASDLQLRMTADGGALALWRESDAGQVTLVWNRYLPRAAWLADAAAITGFATDHINDYALAVDAAGNALVAWSENVGGAPATGRASYFIGASGDWGLPGGFGGGVAVGRPTLAAAPDGTMYLVWTETSGPTTRVRFNRFVPGAGWMSAVNIDTGTAQGHSTQSPRIAVDGAGAVVAIWTENDGLRENLWSDRLVPGAGWSGPQLLEANDTEAVFQLRLAVDPRGNALVVWCQSSGAAPRSVWSVRFTPTSGWQLPLLVSSGTDSVSWVELRLDPSGRGHALWQQSVANFHHLWSNQFR